jgi:hypothetical protein
MVNANRTAESDPEPASVSDVDARLSDRGRARVTFWVLTIGCALVGAIVVAPSRGPLVGLVFGALVGAVLGFAAGALMAVWPLLRALWHWLTELVTVAVLAVAGTALASWIGPWWAVAGMTGAAGSVAAVRPLRRRLRAVVWCAIVRHRLRVCFAAFIRARNRLNPGLAPLILLARPTPAGERVWVWLRTGLDAAELESRTAKIAVTCWAADVQVTTSRRFAALVRLDVTRRDPLTKVVASPLASMVPGQPTVMAPVPVDLSALALDLADTPEELPAPVPARRPRSSARSGSAELPSSAGVVDAA